VYGGVPAAVVTDTLSLKGPAGALSVAVSTSATATNIAARLAWIAARTNAVGNALAVGSLAYDLLASSGVRQGSAGAEMDAGAAPTPKSVFTTNGISGDTEDSACAAYKVSLGHPGYTQVNEGGYLVSKAKVYKETTPTENGPYGYRKYCKIEIFDYQNNLIYPNFRREVFGTTTKNTCTPINDALTGQSYIPGMYSDGKCITGRYTAATESQVSARVLPAVQADPSAGAKAVTGAGQSVESSPYSVTGPASQVGSPTTSTTTGPNGTTTTTSTPTYNYTYNGDTITINTTNTTNNSTTNNGVTTNTTTTTTSAGGDDKGMCALYPDSLACMQPGTPPADTAPVPKSVPITFDPVQFGGQGSCPPPITFAVLGGSYALSWTPLCEVLVTWVRPVVLVLSVAAAAMVFIGGLKS
jgi:hypothetical protein